MFQNLFTKVMMQGRFIFAASTEGTKAGTVPDFTEAVKPIVDFIKEREKAKAALKNGIIGFVLIFVLLVLLSGVSGLLVNWVSK